MLQSSLPIPSPQATSQAHYRVQQKLSGTLQGAKKIIPIFLLFSQQSFGISKRNFTESLTKITDLPIVGAQGGQNVVLNHIQWSHSPDPDLLQQTTHMCHRVGVTEQKRVNRIYVRLQHRYTRCNTTTPIHTARVLTTHLTQKH